MMAGGIVLLSLGGLATLGGLTTVATSESFVCWDGDCVDETLRAIGIGLTVGGLASLAIGLPLTIVGARRVPVEEDDNAWLVPTPVIHPTGGGLRWTF